MSVISIVSVCVISLFLFCVPFCIVLPITSFVCHVLLYMSIILICIIHYLSSISSLSIYNIDIYLSHLRYLSISMYPMFSVSIVCCCRYSLFHIMSSMSCLSVCYSSLIGVIMYMCVMWSFSLFISILYSCISSHECCYSSAHV